jgi:hypothetical protein
VSSPADFCPTCGLLKTEHDEEMKKVCAVLDPAQPNPYSPHNATDAHDSADADADASGHGEAPPRPTWPEVSDPETEPVNIANILLHWTESVDRELEELAEHGTGRMLPYSLDNDPFVMREDLVRALVALRGVSGTENKGLIGKLRDLADDLAGALASVMDEKVEHLSGWDVERTYGTTRKSWQREVLAKEVTEVGIRALGAAEDAERIDAYSAARAAQVVHNAFAKAFLLGPRAGALRELGLNPDNYSESSPGRTGIIVRPHTETVEQVC